MTRLAEAFFGWYDARASIFSTNSIAKYADSFRRCPSAIPDLMTPIWFFGEDRPDPGLLRGRAGLAGQVTRHGGKNCEEKTEASDSGGVS
jgi:hypothetical protein